MTEDFKNMEEAMNIEKGRALHFYKAQIAKGWNDKEAFEQVANTYGQGIAEEIKELLEKIAKTLIEKETIEN